MSRLWLILALLVLVSPSSAQQRSLGASTTDNVGVFRTQTGRRLTYVCPERVTMSSSIWGTDVYTDDSPLCLAAIHAGVLPRGQAGVVTVLIGGSANSFQGSSRNGVTSQSYGSCPKSWSFNRCAAPVYRRLLPLPTSPLT